MDIRKENFGSFWSEEVSRYTLAGSGGMSVGIIDYGGIIQSLEVPGRDGIADVALGFDTLYDYLRGHPFFGAVAGRVANRIPDGRFTLDGVQHQLSVNAQHGNHLHGGFRGFDKYVWQSDAYHDGDAVCVRLERISPEGEEGYPGRLVTVVTYTLAPDNTLVFDVAASADAATIVNVVQHSYFNLAGHDRGDVRAHELTIAADAITPTDHRLVPTGEIAAVAGTPFDFRQPTVVGAASDQVDGVFDVNYVLSASRAPLHECARLVDPGSGRAMTVATNMPGVQFYNGHKIFEQNQLGKGGHRYPAWAGLCLETQHFPNAINEPSFPSMVTRPGEDYHHRTTYSFTIE
jgi:aldose 1-epimerase